MKFMDRVKVLTDKHEKDDIFKGDIVRILLPEIRGNAFGVVKTYECGGDGWITSVNIKDLEYVESDIDAPEDWLRRELPGIEEDKDKWWCKVVDGYIVNLAGEKKNKIPYDYNS